VNCGREVGPTVNYSLAAPASASPYLSSPFEAFQSTCRYKINRRNINIPSRRVGSHDGHEIMITVVSDVRVLDGVQVSLGVCGCCMKE
jgi:hypothetical protein